VTNDDREPTGDTDSRSERPDQNQVREPRSPDPTTVTPDRPGGLADGITVVVLGSVDDDVGGCLASLRRQTLSPDLFDVDVAVEGPSDRLAEVTSRFADSPFAIRLIGPSQRGVFCLRDLGVAAAQRRTITFVAAGDRLSPDYLSLLRQVSRDDRLYVTSVNSGLTSAAGVTVPAELAKRVERDVTPRSSHDAVFFLTMVARGDCTVETLPADAGYEPGRRPETAGADDFDTQVTDRLRVVAQLDVLCDDAQPDATYLIQRYIQAEVDRMNDYLRRHPADHGKAVVLLDGYDLRHFPYERLNAGLARTLVVTSSRPSDDLDAIGLAKRIRQRHEIVDILRMVDPTGAGDGDGSLHLPRDRSSFQRIAGPYVEAHLAVDTNGRGDGWPEITAFSEWGLEKVVELERHKGPYERIYSLGSSPAAHLLAARYTFRNPVAEWVAEPSEPFTREVSEPGRRTPTPPGRFLETLQTELGRKGIPVPKTDNPAQWCAYLVCACADTIVSTSQNLRDQILSRCPDDDIAAAARRRAVVVLVQPTLPSVFYSIADCPYALDDSCVNIGYFGSPAAGHGLADVLTGLAKLDADSRAKLRLHVFARRPDELEATVEALGLDTVVRVSSPVGYLESLNLATRFDCLVIDEAVTASGRGPELSLPSTWSDYAGAGRPVWGVVEAGSPLSALPLDYTSPVGDPEAAADVLHRLLPQG